jgi:hypothetical protein
LSLFCFPTLAFYQICEAEHFAPCGSLNLGSTSGKGHKE